MAVLSEAELKQAIREWAEKRGLPVDDKTGIVIAANIINTHHNQTSTPNSDHPNYAFTARLDGLEMPPKAGPYR